MSGYGSQRWVGVWVGLAMGWSSYVAGAQAHEVPPGMSGAYSMIVEDLQGRPLRTFFHSGDRYTLGESGQRYNIRIRNHTSRRVEAVVTVDGRDVISGRMGDYGAERGYVLPPHGTVLIEGFRKSLADVAAFRFSAVGDSYSSRMGTPENVGVIGVALFPERIIRPRPSPIARPRTRSAPSPSRQAGEAPRSSAADGASTSSRESPRAEARSSSQDNLGTAYGERQASHVREVRFVRAQGTRPAAILTLRYDDRRGLLARGIDVDQGVRPVARHSPDPFPRGRFAPPPPAY